MVIIVVKILIICKDSPDDYSDSSDSYDKVSTNGHNSLIILSTVFDWSKMTVLLKRTLIQ